MDVGCEYCGQALELLDGAEMTSAVRRYRCDDCLVTYEQDASGLVVEESEPPR